MVKKLMESIREQKKNSILAMVTISGEVVFEVIIPLLMANLIDYGIDMGDMGYIVKMGIVLLLSALGQLCPQPAPRHVLQGAELFIFKHR